MERRLKGKLLQILIPTRRGFLHAAVFCQGRRVVRASRFASRFVGEKVKNLYHKWGLRSSFCHKRHFVSEKELEEALSDWECGQY